MFNKPIIGIMATSLEGTIAKDGAIPWYYPDDLTHFKQLTKGQIMVMGRKTFETMPDSIFTDRVAIIFSRKPFLPRNSKYINVHNIKDFFSVIKFLDKQKIIMVGGAEIAHLFLQENLITEFILTKINKSYLGDTHLNLAFFENWSKEILNSNDNYTIMRLIPNYLQNNKNMSEKSQNEIKKI